MRKRTILLLFVLLVLTAILFTVGCASTPEPAAMATEDQEEQVEVVAEEPPEESPDASAADEDSEAMQPVESDEPVLRESWVTSGAELYYDGEPVQVAEEYLYPVSLDIYSEGYMIARVSDLYFTAIGKYELDFDNRSIAVRPVYYRNVPDAVAEMYLQYEEDILMLAEDGWYQVFPDMLDDGTAVIEAFAYGYHLRSYWVRTD